jgi:hypothetical protein
VRPPIVELLFHHVEVLDALNYGARRVLTAKQYMTRISLAHRRLVVRVDPCTSVATPIVHRAQATDRSIR